MGQAALDDPSTKCTLASGRADGDALSKTTTAPVEGKTDDSVPEYKLLNFTLEEIRQVIPPRLFERSTARAMVYVVRDIILTFALAYGASRINDFCAFLRTTPIKQYAGPYAIHVVKWGLWATYWWFQSLVFTGLWVIGHEAGHRGLSPNGFFCDTLGYFVHSALLTPYWSWKISHHRHHMTHGSMERDELWMPATRSELNLPAPPDDHESVYEEYFSDSPIYALFKLLSLHFFAFQIYLMFNLSGNKNYPAWTSHYNPNSVIFRDGQRKAIVLSDIGVIATLLIVRQWSLGNAVLYYWIPWFGMSHWIIFMTFLHHTDPRAPHFRDKAWTFTRGAAATIDRDFLGWQGRYLMHGISHWHVVHHYFPKIPFYHCEEATEHVKKLLGDQYISSDTNVFKAFWQNWNDCRFVEDDGAVVFYRDRKGQAVRKDLPEE